MINFAITLNAIPGEDHYERILSASCEGLNGVRATNMDLDFEGLHAATHNSGVEIVAIDIQKGWRPLNGSQQKQQRREAEECFLNAVNKGLEIGVRRYTTSIETGFFEHSLSKQIEGMRISVEKVIQDSRNFNVLIRPKIDDLFYGNAENAEHATDLLIHYLDWFGSSRVSIDFDIGIHSMYGDPSIAIRKLASRIQLITVTSYCYSKSKLCNLNECDLDWKSIGESLSSIGFDGAIVLSFCGNSKDSFRDQISFFRTKVVPVLLE